VSLENRQLLAIEFAFCLVAWASIAKVFVWPRLAQLEPGRALRVLIAPQMFRIIGMTLLAKNVVGAGLDPDFARGVAIGDLATSVLAVSAFLALARPGRPGVVLAAITTAIGAADLLHNLVAGMQTNAANDLGAAWFVVALIVPLMLVAHVAAALKLWQVLRR